MSARGIGHVLTDGHNAATCADCVEQAARARALAAVRRATIRRERAERAWRLALLDAAEYRCPLRDVGAAAGVSHVRVLQVVRELEGELS